MKFSTKSMIISVSKDRNGNEKVFVEEGMSFVKIECTCATLRTGKKYGITHATTRKN